MSENNGFPPLPDASTPTPASGNAGNQTGPLAKFAGQLADANLILGQLGPLVGGTILTVKMMIALLKKSGVDVKDFETEAARLESSLGNLQGAIDEFNQKYPRALPSVDG